MEKLSKRGFYVVKIKDAKGEIDFNKKYSYDVYYYTNKNIKKRIKNEFGDTSNLKYYAYSKNKEELLYQEGIDILYYDESESKFVIPKEKTKRKEKKYSNKKFYCVILEGLDELDIIFSDKKYKQIIYEFDTKEQQEKFIKSGKADIYKRALETTGTLNLDKNILLMRKKNNKLLMINSENIISEEDDYEQIIIYPSKKRYLFVTDPKKYVPSDALRDAIEDMRFYETEELEMFLYEIKSRSKRVIELDSVEEINNNCFERDDLEIVCAYNGLWGFLNKVYFENFENLRNGKTYCDSLITKTKESKKSALTEVKNLLISLEVIDKNGCILSPYDQIFYTDMKDVHNKGSQKELKK